MKNLTKAWANRIMKMEIIESQSYKDSKVELRKDTIHAIVLWKNGNIEEVITQMDHKKVLPLWNRYNLFFKILNEGV